MSQHELELILTRELVSHLSMPVFVVHPDGDLLFYNEPAESLLGLRFEETGAMPVDDWGTRFRPTDGDGTPLAPEELPLVRAMTTGRPCHGDLHILGADGVHRHLEITAIPLTGEAGRMVGAAAIFWEASP